MVQRSALAVYCLARVLVETQEAKDVPTQRSYEQEEVLVVPLSCFLTVPSLLFFLTPSRLVSLSCFASLPFC